MSTLSASYVLARTLYEVFCGRTLLMTAAEIERSGIVQRKGHISGIIGVVAFGIREGRQTRQRLSLGSRGLHLSTTDCEYGGRVTQYLITAKKDDDDSLEALEDSMFMDGFLRIMQARHDRFMALAAKNT